VFCPGCGTSRAIDLRKVDRHPLASVATLVGIGADAEDPRAARLTACGESSSVEPVTPGPCGRSTQTAVRSTISRARKLRANGRDWIFNADI
jgi:hypothetical protein